MVKKASRATKQPRVKHTPAIEAYLADLEARFGTFRVSPEETRKIVDREMGDRLLSDLIIEGRQQG